MLGKKTINGKGSVSVAGLARIFAMAFVAIFVMSFASQSFAKEDMATLKGEVVGFDSYSRMLTVRSSEAIPSLSIGKEGEVTFSMDSMTNVTSCLQNKSFHDITIGEKVTVTYHERDGKLVANAVDIAPVVLACYDL